MRGNPALVRFFPCVFPPAFHMCVHPLTLILLGGQDPDRCWTVQKHCDTARACNAAPCHASEQAPVPPRWQETRSGSGWCWLPQPSLGPPLPAARSHSCEPKPSCVSFFKSQEGELQTVWKTIKSGKLFKTSFIALWNSCFPRVQMNPMVVKLR